MAQLAILGHCTRGKEVIEILEMLGGKNDNHCCGGFINRIYFINEYGYIESSDKMHHLDYFQLSLEEFLEKYPHKVGDKVQHKGATSCGSIYIIEQMKWEDNQVKYIICNLYWKNCKYILTSKDLQPYKEETMEEQKQIPPYMDYDIRKEETMEFETKEIPVMSIDRIGFNGDTAILVPPEGFEFYAHRDKVYIQKKKPKYPKTYEECCNVLNTYCTMPSRPGYKEALIAKFQELLICRDAYWKIAGDWKPDVMYCDLYCIGYDGNVITWKMQGGCRLLVFPTEEMRDAFYENFKEEIESVKELL